MPTDVRQDKITVIKSAYGQFMDGAITPCEFALHIINYAFLEAHSRMAKRALGLSWRLIHWANLK